MQGFHRFDGELVSRAEWPQMPDALRRVARALGPEPLDDLTHLLPSLEPLESPGGPWQKPAVEFQLVAGREPFAARAVWRTLYGLGLHWGDLDLFHWGDPPRFSVSALGIHADFQPERVEGGVIDGLMLCFEPGSAFNAVEQTRRMALALAALRERLGGRPLYDGRELDSAALERLVFLLSDPG